MLDILEGFRTQARIPMIVRLVKPLEGYGRPVETEDGYEFSCINDSNIYMLEFYDARYPDAYRDIGINGAFVTRYSLDSLLSLDHSEEYVDLEASNTDYRFSESDFKCILEWAESEKPLMVGVHENHTLVNTAGYASMLKPQPQQPDQAEFPIPEINDVFQTLTFTESAQSQRELVSLGRNGWMKTVGVQVVDSEVGYVSMIPVNSRQQAGRCEIQIPRDRGHIEAVIDMYQKILEDIQRGE